VIAIAASGSVLCATAGTAAAVTDPLYSTGASADSYIYCYTYNHTLWIRTGAFFGGTSDSTILRRVWVKPNWGSRWLRLAVGGVDRNYWSATGFHAYEGIELPAGNYRVWVRYLFSPMWSMTLPWAHGSEYPPIYQAVNGQWVRSYRCYT
jgi:hypothetical protein